MVKILIHFLYSVIWCIFLPLDFLCTICSADNRFHKWMNDLYHKHVRTLLTGNRMSRTSYTLSHDFFLLLFFCVISALTYKWIGMGSKDIKNKFLRVSVTSPTNDTIRFFNLNLSPDWEYNDSIYPHDFSLYFLIDNVKKNSSEKDTAQFEFSIRSSYDSYFYPITTGDVSLTVKDSLLHKPKEATFQASIVKSELRSDSFTPITISAKSDVMIFSDEDSPYVNFYLSFDKSSDMALFVDKTEAQKGDYGFHIWLNSKMDSQLIGNKPFDVVSIKPEPDTYNPYIITYSTPEKVEEVLNKGIYISTVNRDLKAKLERKSFFYSVLFGAFVSLILGVFIALLTKWRNLSRSIGRKNPYD